MSDTNRATIEKLRLRAYHGETLTAEEQAIMDDFYRRIEAMEATYLTPANERLRQQNDAMEERLHELEAVRDKLSASYEQLRRLVGEIESLQKQAHHLLSDPTVVQR
jgi:DNA anti-recombination protein RmuC